MNTVDRYTIYLNQQHHTDVNLDSQQEYAGETTEMVKAEWYWSEENGR